MKLLLKVLILSLALVGTTMPGGSDQNNKPFQSLYNKRLFGSPHKALLPRVLRAAHVRSIVADPKALQYEGFAYYKNGHYQAAFDAWHKSSERGFHDDSARAAMIIFEANRLGLATIKIDNLTYNIEDKIVDKNKISDKDKITGHAIALLEYAVEKRSQLAVLYTIEYFLPSDTSQQYLLQDVKNHDKSSLLMRQVAQEHFDILNPVMAAARRLQNKEDEIVSSPMPPRITPACQLRQVEQQKRFHPVLEALLQQKAERKKKQ